jgi:DNA-binding response OmpR family regulator
MDWQTLLITVFVYIDEQYKTQLWPFCQRMSNNNDPQFSDEELLTIFMYAVMKKRFELKDIYNYAHSHLREWFPHLPSYVAFVQRLNRFDSLFPMLIELILNDFSGSDLIRQIRLIDSMPIILANAKRSSKAKVANQLANKGYCASKGIYYYGVKIHILGLKREGTLPLPEYIGLTSASDHDLIAFNHIAHLLKGGEVYADKAYIDEIMKQLLEQEQQVKLHTPIKKKKGQEKLELFDQLLSSTVSRIRQPIESLFNWIQEKTNIQLASKVRSYNGLMVHVFGKLAAAMFLLVFNP